MCKKIEDFVLKDFYVLVDYLAEHKKLKNPEKYKNNFAAFLLHARHIKTYEIISPFCINKKVLDIGCFIGYGESIISPQANLIVAIDSDAEAIKFARENRNLPNVEFLNIEAKKLPYKDFSFDVIIASQVIEHIPPEEINEFLSEVKRLLVDRGIFIVVTPNRKFRLPWYQKPFNSEHYQEFTARSFLQILKRTFNNVQINGLRASNWIEEIERQRVRKTILTKIKKLLRKFYSKMKQEKTETTFSKLFEKFSMDDFYLVEQRNLVEKSMELVGICNK